ncbi:MAG: ROK family protein, partial [Rhodomicrobium sp.]
MWRVGVDLGGTKIEALALSPSGQERVRVRAPTPRGDYEGTLDAIVSLVEACTDGLAASEIAGIGVGIPGSLSPRTGLVRNANSTWLNGRSLHRDLQARSPWPVVIENDANCFALSEAADGAAHGCRAVFGVILGTGVGGGLVIEGHSQLGHNAVGGEWGHNPLPWPDAEEYPGPVCYCGKRGCIE